MDSASPLLFPGTAWEHWRGFSWGFVGKIRGGWAGQAGSPGPGAWALIQSGIISEYLCECWGGYTESRSPGSHSLL